MLEIRDVAAAQTHALRRETLRDGIPDAPVTHPDDERADSFHLIAFKDGIAIGTVSCAPGAVRGDGRHGWRLYQMGVVASAQRTGAGRALVETVVDHVKERGGAILWAMARDSAQSFYVACGFTVIGDEYPGWNQISHHTVIRQV